MMSLCSISSEIFLSVLALTLLVAETFFVKKGKLWVYISIAALVGVLVYLFKMGACSSLSCCSSDGATRQLGQTFSLAHMLVMDQQAVFFKISILLVGLLVFWFSLDYREYTDLAWGTYSSLLLFSLVGMMLLVSSVDLLMAVISLELLGIPLFILTGFILNRRSSTEGAIKFFLVGSFSTAILLFGVSYYYGYFGTTSLTPLLTYATSGQTPDMMLALVLIFLLAGLGFKLAMAPFHMWAPDAYEGAPTPVTAFLSVAPKAAAIGFVLRLFSQHAALHFTPVLAGFAALTMTVGNIGALHQTNVKRLLAYSSIAQVGYILAALAAGQVLGAYAAMLYTFVYLFMNLGVFAILLVVSNESHSDDLESFNGLYQRSFGLSLCLILLILSMTGIPPLAGFVGKFTIFSALMSHPPLLWLSVVAVINSVVSLYYYFRFLNHVFFKEAIEKKSVVLTPALTSCLLLTLSVTLMGGLFPGILLNWVRHFVGS